MISSDNGNAFRFVCVRRSESPWNTVVAFQGCDDEPKLRFPRGVTLELSFNPGAEATRYVVGHVYTLALTEASDAPG